MIEIVSKSLEDTENLAKNFLKNISLRKDGATVIALSGDLGSGKTTFVRSVARLLGISDRITSPTFVIMKNYTLNALRFTLLIHIDAYRLKSGGELKKLSWHEIISNPKNLIFIEWPKNVSDAVPENAVKINFEFIDEKTRKIVLGI